MFRYSGLLHGKGRVAPVLNQAMKSFPFVPLRTTNGKWRYDSIHYYPPHEMEVSGQLNVPLAVFLKKYPSLAFW
jgi:hypothetical protein